MTTETSEGLRGTVESERATTLAAYVLHLVGSMSGVPSLVALCLNYLKRDDFGVRLGTHHRFMIRTFWWTALWIAIGWFGTAWLIGWVVLAVVWLWYVYRQVLGLIRLANGEPMPV